MRTYFIIFGLASVLFGTAGVAFYSEGLAPLSKGERLLREGQIYLERDSEHSLNKAMTRFTSLIAKFGDNRIGQEAKYHLGVAYSKMGFQREAYMKFRQLFFQKNLHSDDFKDRIQFQLGRLQIIQNLEDEGLARFYNLLRTTEDAKLRAKIYLELGNHYLRTDDVSKARDSFERAVMEDPFLEEARVGLTRAYRRLGNYFASYQVYDSYLNGQGNISKNKGKLKKNYSGSALAIGKKLYKAGASNKTKYYEAIKHFQVARQAGAGTNDGEEALFYLGLCFRAVGDYSVAKNYFEQVGANGIDFRDAEAAYYLALIAFETKKYALAASLFKAFIEKYPKHQYVGQAQAYYEEATQLLQIESGYVDDNIVSDNDVQAIDGEEDESGPVKFTSDYKVQGKQSFYVPENEGELDSSLEAEDDGIDSGGIADDDEVISGF